MEQPGYYGIIPARVRYDENLCANAKLLYAEISCLTNKFGICWAGNDYFADLYKVDTRTISRWVSQLKEAKHILTSYTYIEGSKEVEKRMMWLVDSSIVDSDVVTKLSGGYRQNCLGGGDKKTKDNTTSNNTTRYNKSKFIPPTLKELTDYIKEKNYLVDPSYFLEYYSLSNWKNNAGKPMKDWKLTLLTWNKNIQSHDSKTTQSKPFHKTTGCPDLSWQDEYIRKQQEEATRKFAEHSLEDNV